MDIENVITHLQIIHTWAEFARERDLQFFTPKHLEDIAQWSDDAISLLKEQEAVEPNVEKAILDYQSWHYICGDCGGQIDINDNYCRHCGRVVAHLSNKI